MKEKCPVGNHQAFTRYWISHDIRQMKNRNSKAAIGVIGCWLRIREMDLNSDD
ncbi:hypothetical protein ACFFJN_04490 [Erwinia mallotivora]|uniref:hypothetical protein n=1 Tax=Erwinia mallotivora TaxID=69222 RepID=UPI0035E4FD51